jgi:hypothetical protein
MNTEEHNKEYIIVYFVFSLMLCLFACFGYFGGRVELKHHLCQLKQYEYCGKKELLDKLQ